MCFWLGICWEKSIFLRVERVPGIHPKGPPSLVLSIYCPNHLGTEVTFFCQWHHQRPMPLSSSQGRINCSYGSDAFAVGVFSCEGTFHIAVHLDVNGSAFSLIHLHISCTHSYACTFIKGLVHSYIPIHSAWDPGKTLGNIWWMKKTLNENRPHRITSLSVYRFLGHSCHLPFSEAFLYASLLFQGLARWLAK